MIFLRVTFYILIFLITLIYFFPKNELISYVNSTVLSQYKTNAKITFENKVLNYVSSDSSVTYQKNLVADISSIKVSPYILFNEITLKNIKLKGIAGSVFPSKMDNVKLLYTITDPTRINMKAEGSFGKAIGYFDLLNSLIHIEVSPSRTLKKNFSFILKYMKRSKNVYTYEYKL